MVVLDLDLPGADTLGKFVRVAAGGLSGDVIFGRGRFARHAVAVIVVVAGIEVWTDAQELAEGQLVTGQLLRRQVGIVVGPHT